MNKQTLSELRKRFIDGRYTPVDALIDTRKVIEERDGEIHAFLEVFEDAKDAAEEAAERYKNEGEEAPALCGMPIAVKNNILIEGKKATASSRILENYIATYDATVIARLKEAGAVFVGATNMDEFACGSSTEYSAFGVTKNPHDTTRVPGGSSGGSAAAVAMSAVPVALGTDTGGSVRQPASFCGVVGLKPTYGAVSRYGLIAMGSSLDQAGVLAVTVEDAKNMFSVISGRDPMDATTINEDTYEKRDTKEVYRVGIPTAFLEGVDPDVRKVYDTHVAALKTAGHVVREIELPLMARGLSAYYIVMPAEVSSNLARYDGMRYGFHVDGTDVIDDYFKTRAAGFGAEVKRRILLGTYVLSAGYYDAYYGKAEQVRHLMREELNATFRDIDFILTPTAPTPAFKIGEKNDPLSMYLGDIYTVPVNLTGVPALSIPAGIVERDGSSLPIGVQYIAPHGGENILFDIGAKMHD